MISLLYGENDFELKNYLKKIINDFSDKNAIEKIDGNDIVADNLADLLSGMSLFSTSRLIVIYDASQNKEVWEKMLDYIDTETQLILVEPNPDKRTKTFKQLQKSTEVKEFKNLNENEAKNWLLNEAKNRIVDLSPALAEKVVARAGVDQWKLHFALQKLVNVAEINEQSINEQIEPSAQSNVFALIDASLQKSPRKVHEMVDDVSQNEDPYFFFGLLSSQIFQLVTLSVSDKKPAEVAADLGVHPYPLQKLSSISRQLNRGDLKNISSIIAQCDDQIKRSGAEPWLLIEQALVKIANR
ncbi:MAG: DNA polymerase III subunit delta [Candidatus Saccharibacteria bacterium]|nr:DNA polymerase III subunit delta [Candidatus Saccharibacteria bacterium]